MIEKFDRNDKDILHLQAGAESHTHKMILQIVTYLKEFSSVTVVTEDLMLRTFSFTTFIMLFLSILVTGIASCPMIF